MGDADDRARYDAALREFLSGVRSELAEEDRDKVDRNPLRVLDSKRPQTAAATADAPVITDVLSAESTSASAGCKRG